MFLRDMLRGIYFTVLLLLSAIVQPRTPLLQLKQPRPFQTANENHGLCNLSGKNKENRATWKMGSITAASPTPPKGVLLRFRVISVTQLA